jgi:hypothetical protein
MHNTIDLTSNLQHHIKVAAQKKIYTLRCVVCDLITLRLKDRFPLQHMFVCYNVQSHASECEMLCLTVSCHRGKKTPKKNWSLRLPMSAIETLRLKAMSEVHHLMSLHCMPR